MFKWSIVSLGKVFIKSYQSNYGNSQFVYRCKMSKTKVTVDLFYDVISPYSYIGFELLSRYRNVWHKMDLRLKPFLLGAVMKASKNNPPMMVQNKAIYMMKDLRNLSNYYGIPLKVPSNFGELALQKGSLKAMRFVTAIHLLSKGELTENTSREFYKRIFCNEPGLDISEEASFREVANKLGFDEALIEKVLKHMESEETKNLLKQNTDEAVANGAFGSPTILVYTKDKPQLIFGSDRIEIIAHLIGEEYQGPLLQVAKL